MELWIGAVNLGLLYTFMAIGTFITYKIYNFPDITVDGSFTTGASVAAVLIIGGMNPFLVLPIAFIAGALAGVATAYIHTKFNINGLLSGILIMTALYSVNLRIMDKSNIPLLNSVTFASIFEEYNPGINPELWLCFCLIFVILIVWLIISYFFKTDLGITMRATGNNQIMVSANGVNVNFMKIFGVALANGFVGLSGGLVAQYQGFSDIGMGVGSVVFSLAAVIIGEALIKSRSIVLKIFSVIIGSIIFRLMVALALYVGLNPNDLKLITAVFVLVTLITSGAFGNENKLAKWFSSSKFNKYKKIIFSSIGILIIPFIAYLFMNENKEDVISKKIKVGIVIPNDAEMLTLTKEGLIDELNNSDYEIEIVVQNANSDLPTLNSIVDNFINQKIDVFVPISTVSTQAVVKKIKDKPVVFGTVANPFIIGVGESDTKHPANVTGVYGTAPIADLIEYVKILYPKKLRIGALWNNAYPNSKFNIDMLREIVLRNEGFEFVDITVSSSNEVYQAATALANKNIDAIVLVPDLTVFAAFDSVIKAANVKNIPVFTNDVEMLGGGALLVYGYDYYRSGIQTAKLIERIIEGEDVSKMSYETHKNASLGLNYDVAKKLKISFPNNFIEKANMNVDNGKLTAPERIKPNKNNKEKTVAVMQFVDNSLLTITTQSAINELKNSGLIDKYKLKVDHKNAQGDFNTSQSIAKEIVSKKYDYIITISTLSAQAMANNNKTIPHVFCAVTDPIKAGLATDFKNHLPNLTGLATPQPVETTIKLMRELYPNAKTIGMLWNSSEANSEACTIMARDAAKKFGFKLIEKTVSNINEIEDALKAVINQKPDLFLTSGDVTVSMVVPSVANNLLKKKIPYFTNTPDDINSGALISIGANYEDVGIQAVKVFKRILEGEKPADIDIIKYVPEQLCINVEVAEKLGLKIPESIIKNAYKIKR